MTLKVTTVRLPDKTLQELKTLAERLGKDRSEIMREIFNIGLGELKLRYALELYEAGKISIGRLAELAGLDYRETLLELKRRRISVKYGEERFLEEVGRTVG